MKFSNYECKHLVKKSAKNPKGTEFGISGNLEAEERTTTRTQKSYDIKDYFVKDRTFVGGREYVP